MNFSVYASVGPYPTYNISYAQQQYGGNEPTRYDKYVALKAAEQNAYDATGQPETEKPVLNPGEDTKRKAGKRSSPAECETCKNRKYQDGSNEMDVSFKAPGHIAPGAAAGMVMAHERQHVANAYQKASENNGVVERASVRLKTDVCPECGRTYVAGGETSTQIRYYNEENPYQKDMKEFDAANKYRGLNVDIAA